MYHARTLALALLQWMTWLLLAAAALHLARSAWAARGPLVESAPPLPPAPSEGSSSRSGEARNGDDALPSVTVQVPLRDEVAVAERVLRAAAALDWPRGRLQVQALDDSDDATSAIVDRVAASLREGVHDVEVVRRATRAGFKAGNLQNGLRTARGELVAVLDADAEPPPDLLRRLAAPLLADERLAFAQARWSFGNAGAGLLTRAQAAILDGLMLVEQPLLSARGRPVQFNGTGGLWRRRALDAAGGWLPTGAASVTEDLDLSYRARLAGFRGVMVATVAVGTELPETMAAFRAQQARWVRGGGEGLRALGRRLAGGALPSSERVTMLAHLARHARQPLLALAAVWLPLVAALGRRPPLAPRGVWPALVAAVALAMAGYFAAARRRRGASPVAALALAPLVMALSMGLAPALTVAFLRGLLGGAGAEFVRTPKRRAYRSPVDALALVEVALGLAAAAAAALAAWRGDLLAALGLAAFVAAGLLWVGAGSLIDR